MFAVLFVSSLAAGDYTDPELTAADRSHWGFVPPAKHRPPVVKGPARNPIDRFVLAKLEAAGRGFATETDRRTLVRRLTFDLLGLPPTPAEVDAFVVDPSPDAYETLVERLLASPHFGERQAQHWLDVVRFAESNGYENDGDRPHAWRYRDWVARAFAADKPFNEFVAEQVAGDLLWKDEFGRMRDEARTAAGAVLGGPLSSFTLHPSSSDLLAATGLHRCGPVHVVAGNVDPAENRNEVLTEMANGVGSAVLGLTVGCARCHDHKFDPISLGDYYRLQAFFAGTRFVDSSLATAQEKAAHGMRKAFAEARIRPLKKRIEPVRGADPCPAEGRADGGPCPGNAGGRRDAGRQADGRAEEAGRRRQGAAQPAVGRGDRRHAGGRPGRAGAATGRAGSLRRSTVATTTADHMGGERGRDAAASQHPQAGERPRGKRVWHRPGVLRVAEGSMTKPADRRDLARWLTSPDNPLTARVIVNRLWQQHFGRGIVATPNDFGTRGDRPTHPELLDWLARELVEHGWSLKHLHRLMVTSAAYRQTSGPQPDPLVGRQARRRLDAEAVRDAMLAAAGTLNRKLGGPSVRVPLEPEVYDLIFTEGEPVGLWPVSRDPAEFDRRSLYLFAKRNVRQPLLEAFDQPDALGSCAMRGVSTFAPQALILMNGPLARRPGEAVCRIGFSRSGHGWGGVPAGGRAAPDGRRAGGVRRLPGEGRIARRPVPGSVQPERVRVRRVGHATACRRGRSRHAVACPTEQSPAPGPARAGRAGSPCGPAPAGTPPGRRTRPAPS